MVNCSECAWFYEISHMHNIFQWDEWDDQEIQKGETTVSLFVCFCVVVFLFACSVFHFTGESTSCSRLLVSCSPLGGIKQFFSAVLYFNETYEKTIRHIVLTRHELMLKLLERDTTFSKIITKKKPFARANIFCFYSFCDVQVETLGWCAHRGLSVGSHFIYSFKCYLIRKKH